MKGWEPTPVKSIPDGFEKSSSQLSLSGKKRLGDSLRSLLSGGKRKRNGGDEEDGLRVIDAPLGQLKEGLIEGSEFAGAEAIAEEAELL